MAFQIANQTSTSLLRPIPTPSGYSRPGDWLTITDTPGEVQFLMSDAASPLAAILTNFTRGATGDIFIDWGDGITDTISTTAATTTSHTYATGGTPSSLGYDMWKIRVFGDPGTVLTNVRIGRHIDGLNNGVQPSSVLEAIYGDGTQTSGIHTIFQSGGLATFNYLDFVKLPAVISAGSGLGDSAFNGCTAVRKIICCVTSNLGQLGSSFSNCGQLIELQFFQNLPNCGIFNDTFNNCSSLTSLDLSNLSAPNLFSINTAFAGLSSLTSFIVPSLPKVTNFNGMLSGCRNLLSVEWTNWPTVVDAITFTGVFTNCSSLEYVKFPAVGPIGAINFSATFNGCTNLKNFFLPPSYTTVTLMTQMFQNCASLATCILPPSMPNLTSMLSCFNGCVTLQEITLPTTVGLTINLSTVFQNCFELGEIVVPSNYNISGLQGSFANCLNARTITLPNNSQNAIGSMEIAFEGCASLLNLTLPTSLDSVTSLNRTFNGCRSLRTIALPATMNFVTTAAQVFFNCFNLSSITFPTSMTAVTNFAQSFRECRALLTIVLPATSGNVSNYSQAFQNCFSLTSITFPASPQSTALISMNTMLTGTGNLSTTFNTDFIGNPATGSGNFVDGTSIGDISSNPTLDFFCKFARFTANGNAQTRNFLSSLRLRNNGAGQYGGASPQINVSFTSLDQAALVQLFNDLPTVTAKNCNITGAIGAAALTAPERAIATGKGWTLIG